jgi:hypothetical protein
VISERKWVKKDLANGGWQWVDKVGGWCNGEKGQELAHNLIFCIALEQPNCNDVASWNRHV